MKKTEIKRLQEKYLVNGKFAIKYSPFCKFEQSLLFQLWNKIEEFERPDMIAFDMNNLIILEHFRFDGTHEARKGGMEGLREENELEQSFQSLCDGQTSTAIQVYSISRKETPEDYTRNLTKHYNAHYRRIPEYIARVITEKELQSHRISVGFFIENDYPPLYRAYSITGQQIGMVHLFDTKQFLDLFEDSPELDFVLFGHTSPQPELFYMDKTTIKFSRENEIDLTKVQFQSLNEMEWQGIITSN